MIWFTLKVALALFIIWFALGLIEIAFEESRRAKRKTKEQHPSQEPFGGAFRYAPGRFVLGASLFAGVPLVSFYTLRASDALREWSPLSGVILLGELASAIVGAVLIYQAVTAGSKQHG